MDTDLDTLATALYVMDTDLDTLATALYVTTDDLLKAHPEQLPERPVVGIVPLISDAELIVLAVIQALLGYRGAVARQEGVGHESLRRWVAQADVDAGDREGVTSEEAAEIRRLKVENKRLREDVAILRAATTFFVGELDPRNR